MFHDLHSKLLYTSKLCLPIRGHVYIDLAAAEVNSYISHVAVAKLVVNI